MLKDALEEIFESKPRVSDHADHYRLIQSLIDSEQEKIKMYKAVTKVALQWSIPFLLAGLIYWLQTGHWPNR